MDTPLETICEAPQEEQITDTSPRITKLESMLSEFVTEPKQTEEVEQILNEYFLAYTGRKHDGTKHKIKDGSWEQRIQRVTDLDKTLYQSGMLKRMTKDQLTMLKALKTKASYYIQENTWIKNHDFVAVKDQELTQELNAMIINSEVEPQKSLTSSIKESFSSLKSYLKDKFTLRKPYFRLRPGYVVPLIALGLILPTIASPIRSLEKQRSFGYNISKAHSEKQKYSFDISSDIDRLQDAHTAITKGESILALTNYKNEIVALTPGKIKEIPVVHASNIPVVAADLAIVGDRLFEVAKPDPKTEILPQLATNQTESLEYLREVGKQMRAELPPYNPKDPSTRRIFSKTIPGVKKPLGVTNYRDGIYLGTTNLNNIITS